MCALLAILCLAPDQAMAMPLQEYAKTNGNPDVTVTDEKVTFYGMEIDLHKGEEQYMCAEDTFTMSYKGTQVSPEGYPGCFMLDSAEIRQNFPDPGMATLVLPAWDGGGRCCGSYHVFVKNGEKLAHALFQQPRSVDGNILVDGGLLRFYDQSFMDDSVSEGEHYASFYLAIFPRPERRYVFENNAWRVDREGEFPEQYRALYEEFKKNNPVLEGEEHKDENAADAVYLTYYCLMMGGPDQKCRDVARDSLSQENKPLARKLFGRVVEEVMDCNLISNTAVY
ncbi:hypothetical protein GD604_00740 [Desulfolutivibrio sulfoxidireducens]|nr:hypothetical protein GD604_00740 [Desulfolutivibrio sulfoxidireducens]